jgi:tRNA uridine 5-carboxymethylaminomethyl modification enzyme
VIVKNQFDVIVIGAGHAGCEAAYAAARLGAHVGLCTLSADTVAHMPCNPAVGGTAKGHLVREIDALGGLMGRAIDATAIQFKLLNRSRGPAVWSPRAQADKKVYGRWVKAALDAEPNIEWLIGKAGRLVVEHGQLVGLAMEDGDAYGCRALVITTGTFLNGLIHIGPEQHAAGRADEPPSCALAESIKSYDFEWGRLKTGTPPRLDRSSIDFERTVAEGRFTREPGDDAARSVFVSVGADRSAADRLSPAPHQRSRPRPGARQHRSLAAVQRADSRYRTALLSVARGQDRPLPEKERHQIFLEPEGVDAREIYVNGFSMSLPRDVQTELVHALPGLEEAVVLRPGMRWSTTSCSRRSSRVSSRRSGSNALLRGPDQRHIGLRGSRGAGARRRHQRGAPRHRPRRARACGATRPTSAFSLTT